MKWLIIAPDLKDSLLKVVEDSLETKHNCEIDEIYCDEECVQITKSVENLKSLYTATHCIILNVDKLSSHSQYSFLLGMLAGQKTKTFIHTSSDSFLLSMISDALGGYMKVYDTPDKLIADIDANMEEMKKTQIQKECIQELIFRGIPFTADSYAYYIEKEKNEICDLILSAGIDVNAFTSDGVPLVCVATRSDNLEQLKILLERGADINTVSRDRGYSPVMDAVWRKDFDIAKLLIEKGANLDIMSTDGQPILVLAVGNGDKNIVKLLLDSGANPDIKDSMGMSARAYASLFKKQELIELMNQVPAREQ